MESDNVEKTPKVSHRRIIVSVIIGLLVAVMVAGCIFLIITGRLYIGWKKPSDTVATQVDVCGDDVVADANRLFAENQLSGEEFVNFIKGIENQADHNDDATCVMILLQYNLMLNGRSQAREPLARLIELNKKGIFPNNRLDNITPLSTLELVLEEV